MRVADRVQLIRKLAERLGRDDFEWADLDLIFRQFGFSTEYWDTANRDRRTYALAQLEDGPESALIELDEYLFGGASWDTLNTEDLPWDAGTFRLFISHTSGHARLAGEVRGYFARWRVDAFVAHQAIEPTREWERVIEAALASCDGMAVFVTEDLVESKWCDQEVGYALARRVPIVPVRMGIDPYGFIAKFQGAVPSPPRTSPWVADAIFKALANHPSIREKMAAPIVHRFAASTSYDGTRANFELLREILPQLWTQELVDVAVRALTANDQIANAQVLVDDAWRSASDATERLLGPVRARLGMVVPSTPDEDDIPF